MTNTTEVYWDVDGVSLQTYAFNIQTLGGDRMAPPSLRGDDLIVPYMPGSIWMPKVPESRILTLGMWVIGAEEDGSMPTEESARLKFDQNWRKLRKLLWTPRRQFTLTKRFWVLEEELTEGGMNVDDLPRSGNYRLLTATARGTYAGGLIPSMTGPARAIFTVDIKLADPYFYSEAIEIPFSIATSGVNPGPNQTVEILGDDRTTAVMVEFIGPLTNPRITNQTPDPEVSVTYASTITGGERAEVWVNEFSAMHYPAGVAYKAAGNVQHEGDRFWLYVEPGETDLALTADSGTGTAVLTYQPRWF